MNWEVFENITFAMEDGLKEEVQRLRDSMSVETTDDRRKYFFTEDILYSTKALDVATVLVNKFKKTAIENDDFNTNMMAFTNLYYFLKIKDVLGGIDESIVLSISEMFTNLHEKEYFLGLLKALKSSTEEDFVQLVQLDDTVEIAYLCLAVIYMQKILDYRTRKSEKQYDKLAYCYTKIDDKLYRTILSFDREFLFPSFMKKSKLEYYRVFLPSVHTLGLGEVEDEYNKPENEEFSLEEYICDTAYDFSKGTLWCSLAIRDETLGDMNEIISIMGKYMKELFTKNSKLCKLQEERHSFIRDFSHTYENMQAIGLKDIANILMNSTDNQVKQCGRVILAEYGMKNSLKAEVSLLRLNFEDGQNEIEELMRRGISATRKDNFSDIKGVFDDALKICMLRVIYSGNPRGEDRIAKDMYARIKSRAGSMREFVEQFENEVIIGGKCISNFLEKFNIVINFTADEEWSKIFFEKNKHAEVLIRSILSELITNSFKYADLGEPVFYELTENNDRFSIQQYNKVTEQIETDSGVGLQSKGQILEKMNGYQSCFVTESKDVMGCNTFKVTFLLNRRMLEVQEVQNG